MLTLEEAQNSNRCRICMAEIIKPKDLPKDWKWRFGNAMLIGGGQIVLLGGKEFAHKNCLENSTMIDIDPRLDVIKTIGDLKKFIDDLPTSMPVHFKTERGQLINPLFSIENDAKTRERYGFPALEIRLL